MPKSTDDRLTIQRLGGLGGFSLPGSRIKSTGELALSQLSPADAKALDALFDRNVHAAAAVKPDGFTYRLTRTLGGRAKTIDVPEDQVPMSVRNAVKDTLA